MRNALRIFSASASGSSLKRTDFLRAEGVKEGGRGAGSNNVGEDVSIKDVASRIVSGKSGDMRDARRMPIASRFFNKDARRWESSKSRDIILVRREE